MKTFIAAAALTIAMGNSAKAAPVEYGGTVENGGNVVVCHSDETDAPGIHPPDQLIFPYLFLDFVHARHEGLPAERIAYISSWEEARDRISRILGGVSFDLLESFQDFSSHLCQLESPECDPGKSGRLWVAQKNFTVVPPIAGYTPERCGILIGDGLLPHTNFMGTLISAPGYLRAITREEQDSQIVYRYLPGLLLLMKANDPTQYSLLLTHEWLWDHTQSQKVNAQVNLFLFSREIEGMSDKEIRARLRSLGLCF